MTSGEPEEKSIGKSNRFFLQVPFLLAAFSVFYFVDVALRASGKSLWYDEIFTLYFCRLPGLGALWNALKAGIDFNPPLFYWLTRGSMSLFGEGNLAIRLPEILGFWVFSVCLFRFIRVRAGLLPALTGLLLPMVTGAYFYAYDARPHGIVLAGCGLALVCWQNAQDPHRRRSLWLTGFSCSLFLAFMLHCYALILVFPFALVELLRVIRQRRITWPAWFALAIPALLSLPLYLALLRSYGKLNNGNSFSSNAVARWNQIASFYAFLFTPCILVIAAIVTLFAAGRFLRRQTPSIAAPISFFPARTDFTLGLAFLTLPLFGIALGKIVNGPCFSRYFLSTLAGVCITIGVGAGLSKRRTWLPALLVALLVSAVGFNFATLVAGRLHGRGEPLKEPSMGFALNTTPGKPLDIHSLLTEQPPTKFPIVVLNALDFIYLVEYDPALAPQLYFLTTTQSDFIYSAFRRFLECCQMKFHAPLTYAQFVHGHASFLVYGEASNLNSIQWLNELGVHIQSFKVLQGHFLVRFSKSD